MACYFRWSHTKLRTHMLRNHWKTSKIPVTSVTCRNLIKTCQNEHVRWSVSGKVTPCPDSSRCRCVCHRATRATKCGNTHFRSNALVAPSGRLRRLTGRLYHEYSAESVGIPCLGRYVRRYVINPCRSDRLQSKSCANLVRCLHQSRHQSLLRQQ